jgi:hypothetical protein
MLGIPRDVAEHSLDIRTGARPVKNTCAILMKKSAEP